MVLTVCLFLGCISSHASAHSDLCFRDGVLKELLMLAVSHPQHIYLADSFTDLHGAFSPVNIGAGDWHSLKCKGPCTQWSFWVLLFLTAARLPLTSPSTTERRVRIQVRGLNVASGMNSVGGLSRQIIFSLRPQNPLCNRGIVLLTYLTGLS